MTLVEQIKSAVKEALSGDQTSRVQTLEKEKADLATQVADLLAKLAAAEGSLATSQAAVVAKDEEITNLKASLATEQGKTAEFEKKVETAAGQQSAQILAGMHATPVAAKPTAESAAVKEKTLLEQYASISDPTERAQFYVKNKQKFTALLRK